MTFIIVISAHAERFLGMMPAKDREVVLRKLYSIRDDPYPHLKKLKGSKLWRLRVMDYRAILDIVIKSNTIYVVRIRNRRNIY